MKGAKRVLKENQASKSLGEKKAGYFFGIGLATCKKLWEYSLRMCNSLTPLKIPVLYLSHDQKEMHFKNGHTAFEKSDLCSTYWK